MKISGTFLYYDEPNGNGRIYTKKIADSIIKQFEEKASMFGSLGSISDISEWSHVVDIKLNEQDNTLEGTIEILDTSKGNAIKKMLMDHESFNEVFCIRPRGAGTINPETHEVENYSLMSFDIIPKQIDVFSNKKDKCVSCGQDSPYFKTIHIDHRKYYIEGAGQLCETCYIKTFK